ncbi:hypothetical protein J6590_043979 [Homalodisca vitripennis]|nr:hypothetical protein J6590_043979 [Homalodisca vitripennis]
MPKGWGKIVDQQARANSTLTATLVPQIFLYSYRNFTKFASGRVEGTNMMLHSLYKKEEQQNRASLKRIIDTIIFCGENEIPLRGHWATDGRKPFRKGGQFSSVARVQIKLTKTEKAWVRLSLQARARYSGSDLLSDLNRDDTDPLTGELRCDGSIKNCLRMSSNDFECLIVGIGHIISKKDTNYRKTIPVRESISYLFKVSKSAISLFVPDVCEALICFLKDNIQPVDKSTKGMGEKSEGSGPKTKEGKAKSPLSKASLASSTTKDGKHPTILEHKKEKQIMPERRSKRLSSIENIIYYVLSNPIFIKMGWTLTPTDRTVSRVVTFHTTPANPQTYCFRQREEEETKFYPSGNLAVKMEIDGTGGIFYSNGSPAMLIKNTDTGMRLTMYSNPKKDPLMKNSFVAKIIGMFDSSGNGVIYDLEGSKILNFNQFEGVFNNQLKSVTHKWHWSDYNILKKYREKELLNFMAKESQTVPEVVKGKKGAIPAGADKKAKSLEKKSDLGSFYKKILAELPFPQQQKPKVLNENRNIGFKSIILKINKEMALRINGQDSVFVNFFSNKIFYRVDLGIRVDPEIVERIEDLAPDRVNGIPCVFDSLFHLSASLQELKNLHMEQSKTNIPGKYPPLKVN